MDGAHSAGYWENAAQIFAIIMIERGYKSDSFPNPAALPWLCKSK